MPNDCETSCSLLRGVIGSVKHSFNYHILIWVAVLTRQIMTNGKCLKLLPATLTFVASIRSKRIHLLQLCDLLLFWQYTLWLHHLLQVSVMGPTLPAPDATVFQTADYRTTHAASVVGTGQRAPKSWQLCHKPLPVVNRLSGWLELGWMVEAEPYVGCMMQRVETWWSIPQVNTGHGLILIQDNGSLLPIVIMFDYSKINLG